MLIRTFLLLFAVFCIAIDASTSATHAYAPTPANTDWFIALCYPHDNASITIGRDKAFYSNMFFSRGTGSAKDYWIAQSYGRLSFDNSVMSEWTDTALTLSQHQQQSREQKIASCVNAALAKTIQALRTFTITLPYTTAN